MANSFILDPIGGHVSVGNKKGIIGTVEFNDGGVSTVELPLKIIQHVSLEVKSAATYVNTQTFTSNLLTVASAASGDAFHLYSIGV